jgi:hypothetical protein
MVEDYFVSFTEEKPGYYPPGIDLLAFCPSDLAVLNSVHNLRVFTFNIYGRVDETEDFRDAWADPLRVEVLRNLLSKNNHWFVSAVGDIPDKREPSGYKSLDLFLLENMIQEEKLDHVYVHSKIRTPLKDDIHKRLFFQVPSQIIPIVVNYCWKYSLPMYPIQGFELVPSGIREIARWENELRNEALFINVIEKSSLIFYTWPEENNRFAFLTNKYSYQELRNSLKIDDLQEYALRIQKNE